MMKSIKPFAFAFFLIACKPPSPPEAPVFEIAIPKTPKAVEPDYESLKSCEAAYREACGLLNRQFYFSYIQEKPTFKCSSGESTSYTVCDENEIVLYHSINTFIFHY